MSPSPLSLWGRANALKHETRGCEGQLFRQHRIIHLLLGQLQTLQQALQRSNLLRNCKLLLSESSEISSAYVDDVQKNNNEIPFCMEEINTYLYAPPGIKELTSSAPDLSARKLIPTPQMPGSLGLSLTNWEPSDARYSRTVKPLPSLQSQHSNQLFMLLPLKLGTF